eukprot:358031-Prymnesium_polylepis.1
MAHALEDSHGAAADDGKSAAQQAKEAMDEMVAEGHGDNVVESERARRDPRHAACAVVRARVLHGPHVRRISRPRPISLPLAP